MVSEPLLWPFLSSLVFISVTLFSTLLPPSQHPSQPLAVEPPTSSNRRPWVPNLQPPSLRSFTLHRPLPFASLLQIWLQLQLWRYHWDRLAPIYTLVEPLTPSETARAPMRRSKVLFRWSRAPCAFHVPLHIWVFSHVPHTPLTCLHTLSRASMRLADIIADVIHVTLIAPLLMSLACVSRWHHPLTLGVWLLTFQFDRWLWSSCWFWSLTFLQDWLFQVRFSLPCFSRRFHFCSLFLHIVSLNG